MTSRRVTTLAVKSHARAGAGPAAAETLERLRASAEAFGRERPGALTAPPNISSDETMTLSLASPGHALPAMLALADAARPSKTTFGLSIAPAGPGGTPADPASIASAPGPLAAARARECLEETDPRSGRVVIAGRERRLAVSTLCDLVLEAYDAMTPRQRQIVELAKHSPTQQDVATHLDVSRQAVNQSLAAAGFFHLRAAEQVIARRLAALGGEAAEPLPAERDREARP